MTEFSVQKSLSPGVFLAAAAAGVGAGIVGFYTAAILLRRERIPMAPPSLVLQTPPPLPGVRRSIV